MQNTSNSSFAFS